MWILYAIVFHILLLGSIFVIYFRSPVITGLKAQPPLDLSAPAKRLVLFVTDGLRAQSFFRKNLAEIPNLRKLIVDKQGIIGISETRVPTESRPGHIALIAGLYEDPSAVTRGWKENPIEFDTIFKHSRQTFAWGANDILHIFSKWSKSENDSENRLFFDSYNHEIDFSGSEKTYELDEWVFNRVEKFLNRKKDDLQSNEQIIFFLHLLGLDTAGHVHKPNTKLFLENLHYTERRIYETYQLFERIFNDQKTAYVLTSDHGMSNSGSHGGGDNYETQTPFFVWGAGITRNHYRNPIKHIYLNEANYIALHQIEQAQLTPLMSLLLGLPPPTNNFGMLPPGYLNASAEYIARATETNARQLLTHYMHLQTQHKSGLLSFILPEYENLSALAIKAMNSHLDNCMRIRNYYCAQNTSYDIMHAALQGIDYYHNYYHVILLAATTISVMIWLWYLFGLLKSEGFDEEAALQLWPRHHRYRRYLIEMFVVVSAFVFMQKLPLIMGLYLYLPVVVLSVALTISEYPLNIIRNFSFLRWSDAMVIVVCTELLVITFFHKPVISSGFLLFNLFQRKDYFLKDRKFYLSMLLVFILFIFPILPTTFGNTNNYLVMVGFALTIARMLLMSSHIPIADQLMSFIAVGNATYSILLHEQHQKLPTFSQIISWSFMLYTIVSMYIYRDLMPTRRKLQRILILYTILYGMLSTSYESIFIFFLLTELSLSVQNLQSNYLEINMKYQPAVCFRIAFIILLYGFFSMFGAGHTASISSFDPNIIRCFLTTFSPFTIMFLVILKLLIPLFVIFSIMFTLSPYVLLYKRQIFMAMLVICDIMALNFLFLVRNYGSWLEIGTSISHFVIMQFVTLLLVVLANLSELVLRQPKKRIAF